MFAAVRNTVTVECHEEIVADLRSQIERLEAENQRLSAKVEILEAMVTPCDIVRRKPK